LQVIAKSVFGVSESLNHVCFIRISLLRSVRSIEAWQLSHWSLNNVLPLATALGSGIPKIAGQAGGRSRVSIGSNEIKLFKCWI
jgi:hypothetical protein